MTPMVAAIKSALALLCLVALVASSNAATFSMKRGLNMDIWVAWPEESKWADESVLRPYPEWRKSLDDADLAALKAAGFDTIRMPVDPAAFLSTVTAPYRGGLYDDVIEAARAINRAGLKVVVDLHLFPRFDNAAIGMEGVMGDAATFDAYLDIVRRMGRLVSREDPEWVALELMNEPHGECGPRDRDWPERLQKLFAAARASATRTTLILSGACGGSAEGLTALDPKAIPDDNVIWTFHSYAPFLMTHQGALWAGDFIRYVTGLTYPIHAMPTAERESVLDAIRKRIRDEAPWSRRSGMLSYLDEQVADLDTEEKLAAALDAPFKLVSEWATRHGIASEDIFLGEFGMIRQEWENPSIVPAASRAAYYRDMIALSERYGYAWAMWGYGGAFGVAEEFEERLAERDVLDVVRGLTD